MKCSKCSAPMEWEYTDPPHNELCIVCALILLRGVNLVVVVDVPKEEVAKP